MVVHVTNGIHKSFVRRSNDFVCIFGRVAKKALPYTVENSMTVESLIFHDGSIAKKTTTATAAASASRGGGGGIN